MSNEFVGQNGAAIREVTGISVTGCPPARPKAVKGKAKKKKKAKTKAKKKGKK